jgi:hypothetical protein
MTVKGCGCKVSSEVAPPPQIIDSRLDMSLIEGEMDPLQFYLVKAATALAVKRL